VATRRGSGDLDDLKAKLGVTGGSEAVSAPDSTTDSGATETASAPAAAPALSAAAPAPFARPTLQDDPIVAPRTANTTVIIGVAFCVLVGVGFGWGFSQVSAGRELMQSRRTSAASVLDAVEKTATPLRTLKTALVTLTVPMGYKPEIQAAITAAYGAQKPVVEPATLTGAQTLLAYDGTLARKLITFSAASSILAELVDAHVVATERDKSDLEKKQGALRQYGILFDIDGQMGAYAALEKNPAAGFAPKRATKVTFEQLKEAPAVAGAPPTYEVTLSNGSKVAIPVYNLLTIDPAELTTEASADSAAKRYAGRLTDIMKRLDALVELQSDLIKELKEVGS
jgi:hypothetical protein